MLEDSSSSLLKVDDDLLEDENQKLLKDLKEKRKLILASLKERMDIIREAEKDEEKTEEIKPEKT